mmetsp:Transcript_12498/g.12259  ORF Transcript_12498/g.12259 Transcript_12498/m.12259 type:complete len:139 (+) Transcript_12498:1234-1650(+)
MKEQFTINLPIAGRIDTIETQNKIEKGLRYYSDKFLASLEELKKQNDHELIKSQSRKTFFNYGLLIICFLFLKKVLPIYYKDDGEWLVFHFWVDRLHREFDNPLNKEQEKGLIKRENIMLSRIRNEKMHRDFNVRPKL